MDGERFDTWLRPGIYLRGDREYRAGSEPLLLEREEIDHFRRCGLVVRSEMLEGDAVEAGADVVPPDSAPALLHRPRTRRGRPRRFPA
jgi:hypothetical protein